MEKQILNKALQKVAEFIRSVDTTEEISPLTSYDVFFSIADEGALLLNGDDAVQYVQCYRTLVDAVGYELISMKGIESLFQKSILTALDILKKRKEISFDQRIQASIDELRKSLTATPKIYSVYYPVLGIELEGLPIQFGNIQFCKFDDMHLSRFLNCLDENKGDENEKRNCRELKESIIKAEIVDKTVGLVEVEAIDYEAAKINALKELAITLDVINFFSDLIPYQTGHVFLPGDNERCKINVPILKNGEKPSFLFEWEVVGPLMPLSFLKVLDMDKNRKLGFTKINGLLTKKKNELDEILISAIQWAGKATIEAKKEESFLFYAISLESLILLDNDQAELLYRLRTRVAHLLGKDFESRNKISKNVNELYAIRSKLVHRGNYQVTDVDLSLMRFYSKGCILRLLNEEPFASMRNKSELTEWFNEKVLS